MSIEDYVITLVLVALVVRQIHGKKLTPMDLVWPVGLVVYAGVKYLHTIPFAGNDPWLIFGGVVIGAGLGSLCGTFTRIHRLPDDSLLAKATGFAAALWVMGLGSRIAFGLYATNGGASTIARFGTSYHVTGAAWSASLILMSLSEVLGRTVVLGSRAYIANQSQLA